MTQSNSNKPQPLKRPSRLAGIPYRGPGLIYHCRFGTWDRVPVFAQERAAAIVVEALRYRHSRNARIFAYCVMPDHVHVLLELWEESTTLSRWVGDLKRWVSLEVAQGLEHELRWQPGFFERVLRRSDDLRVIAKYILENPVRAGLVASWQDYRWCGSLEWEL